MFKGFLFLLSLLLISLKTFGQYDFQKGFIVMEGDTVAGYIDNTNPGTSSNYCFFKRDSGAAPKTYTPLEIQAYGIYNSRLFVRKTVSFDDSDQLIFLECLVDGVVDLYFCRRSNNDYFFIEKDGNIYPLSKEFVEFTEDGKNLVKESNKYIGILSWLMNDAPELRPEINASRLELNSLVKLSKDYHNRVCADKECIIYYKKQKKVNDSKWHVSAGFKVDYVMSWLNMDVLMNSVSHLFTQGGNQMWIPFSIVRETNAQSKSLLNGVAPGLYLNVNRNSRFSFQIEVNYLFSNNSKVKMEALQVPFYMTYDFLRYRKAVPYMIFGISNEFYTSFITADPLYVNYDRLTDVGFDYAHSQFITTYTPTTYIFEEKKVLPAGYYPVFKVGTGISYSFKEFQKIKFDVIGSYHEINRDQLPLVNSRFKFTTIAFSLRYEFGL